MRSREHQTRTRLWWLFGTFPLPQCRVMRWAMHPSTFYDATQAITVKKSSGRYLRNSVLGVICSVQKATAPNGPSIWSIEHLHGHHRLHLPSGAILEVLWVCHHGLIINNYYRHLIHQPTKAVNSVPNQASDKICRVGIHGLKGRVIKSLAVVPMDPFTWS